MKTVGWILLVGLILWSKWSEGQSTNCQESCLDLGSQQKGLPSAMMCGTYGNNYFVPTNDDVVECFAGCNVGAVYPSVCGCPSDCFSSFGQGFCFPANAFSATWSPFPSTLIPNSHSLSFPPQNVSCVCQPGFTGPDCSSPKCGQTVCGLSGLCRPGPSSQWPTDSCACFKEWTGTNCLTPVGEMAQFPFGFLYNQNGSGTPYWTNRTGSGDGNPLFNLNRIGRVAMELDPEAYLQMLLPANLDTDQYTNCTLYFTNGDFHNPAVQVGARVKGSSSRLLWNKGFNFKLNEIVSGLTISGVSKFGVKYSDPSLIKSELGCELVRSLNTMPAQRSGFATLTVNRLHHGVYWIAEAIDSKFIGFHYQEKNGNFYEVTSHGFLEYLGSDPASYTHIYSQKQGNGNYSDLIQLCRVLNTTYDNISAFEAAISSIFNVEGYLQWLPIEIAIGNSDGYSQKGNNYYLYHNSLKKKTRFCPSHHLLILHHHHHILHHSIPLHHLLLLHHHLRVIYLLYHLFHHLHLLLL
jgi:hypothetical protein